MFFVGAYTSFAGQKQAQGTQVLELDKLGRSRGRAERFLKTHPRKDLADNTTFRAVIFALSEGFTLRNDSIREMMQRMKCDWATAKFHLYREAARDVVATRSEWPELNPNPEVPPLPTQEYGGVEVLRGPAGVLAQPAVEHVAS